MANGADPARVTLADLSPGEEARVIAYDGNEEIHYRMRELGLTRGTVVRVKRFAPLGDPIELVVRGYRLSLRKQDARSVTVERVAAR